MTRQEQLERDMYELEQLIQRLDTEYTIGELKHVHHDLGMATCRIDHIRQRIRRRAKVAA